MAAQLADGARALIDLVCGEYRLWAPQEAGPPRVEGMLSGGHSNCAVLLAGRTQYWVLRIADPTSRSEAQRLQEIDAHNAAASLGMAPPLRFHSARRGFILSDYVPAVKKLGYQQSEPSDRNPRARAATRLEQLAALLQGIHRMTFKSPSTLHSPSALHALKNALPPGSEAVTLLTRHQPQMLHASAIIDCLDANSQVLCHNDLLQGNRIETAKGYLAIDWEYAARGDPFFDLAVCASELSPADQGALLEAYLMRAPSTDEVVRLHAQSTVYQGIEACWFSLRAPDSANTRRSLEKLRRRLQTPDLQASLCP